MTKLVVVLVAFVVAFCGTWIFKSKTPIQRNDDTTNLSNDGNWWNQESTQLSTANEVSDEWKIDPEIPDNYIPIPGEDELYMVVTESGNIEKYRHRYHKDGDDKTWYWVDVNPDIPEDYEPVLGLENVYRVSNADGTVSYLKYIRNDDDTFAFIEVDKDGNIIDKVLTADPDGETIPANYTQVDNNVYAVKNENEVVVGYKERTIDNDGKANWKLLSDNDVKALFSSCSSDSNNSLSYSWPTTEATSEESSSSSGKLVIEEQTTESNRNSGSVEIYADNNADNVSIIKNENGSYTEKQTIVETKIEGNWKITYQTIVSKTYDKDGNLISTNKNGPIELKREKTTTGSSAAAAPNPSLVENNIDSEIVRVSNGQTYMSKLESGVVSALNATRSSNGTATLKYTSNSNANKLAKLFATDMAIYDHAEYQTKCYGDLQSLMTRYSITSNSSSITIWKCLADKNASDINTRFNAISSAKDARLSSAYTDVGISIVSLNGYYYIAEVYLG